jgi:serine protease AprX
MKDEPNKNKYGLKLINADVTLRSSGGKSIFSKDAVINSKTVQDYLPPKGNVERVVEILTEMGFRIVAKGKITINVDAPYEEFQKILDVKLDMKRYSPYIVPRKQRVPDKKGCGVYFEYKGGRSLPIPNQLVKYVEAINLAVPMYFCQSPDPPTPGYFHVKVPTDIARLIDAIQCRNKGYTGAGVKLAMPDQGTFDHPYYTSRGYNITLDETAYDNTADNGSHGTAIAANALAIAPGVEFIGIRNGKKMSSGTAAFQKAVEHTPDVISISWGATVDAPELRASISFAIADGITICCACGNGGDVVFPSSMPEVISIGGAYADENDVLQASTYSSSGILTGVDNGRQMPDVTGFVGQSPQGIYITLPCHPGSDVDTAFGGGVFPNGDETTTTDGWLVASGTSSATPQVAGVVCLLIQSDPLLFRGEPAVIKQRLMDTALDVATGNSASGEAAAIGIDNATGYGVVDAYIALNGVDIWIKDNPNDRGLVPSKGAHWISPDIKVLNVQLANPQNDFDAAIHIDRPVFGSTYYIYIKARNRGIDPANNVAVSFYYADPCTFNNFPADWMDGQSGDPNQGTISVGGLPTNNFLIPTVPIREEQIAGPFLWNPPLPVSATEVITEADGKKRGHFCLLTRIDCTSDPITMTNGTQSTVWLDNNIGMKNLWVIEPGMRFPLTFGYIKEAKKRHFIIDTSEIPQWISLSIEIPKEFYNRDFLSHYRIKNNSKNGDLIILYIPVKRKNLLSFSVNKKITVRFCIKNNSWSLNRLVILFLNKFFRPKKLIATVNIMQYADDKCIGGASFSVNINKIDR